MRKKLNVKLLFLVLLAVLFICSCTREDLLQQENPKETASVSSAKYTSRSLWKEDDVYIGKVQQVFLKHANLEKVKETYGELYWNYAMSFGQFGEKYLLVPVVKKDKVVLLMEAVRKEDRLYFYEKNDTDILTFFQHVLYSNIISHSEVIDGNEAAAKAKYVCSTRTIVIGCLNGQTDCEPVSYSQMVCEWKEGGGNGIPPKSFDPLGDPFGGGGGGGGSDGNDDGYEYPDPPEDTTPCEKIAEIGKSDKTKSLFEKLKTKINSTKEFGEILQESNGQINNISVEGEIGQRGIDINFSGGAIDGFIHSHYTGLLSIFSPADLASLAALNATGNIKDINTFVMGVVTASNTQYMMVIDDPVKFAVFAQQFLSSNGQINDSKTEDFGTLNYFKYNIKKNNLSLTNELGFLKMLDDNNSGIKVLKGSNNSNNWSALKIKNGQIDMTPCN